MPVGCPEGILKLRIDRRTNGPYLRVDLTTYSSYTVLDLSEFGYY